MYRVELKELPGLEDRTGFNAAFLMYRVELKAEGLTKGGHRGYWFLMYRVELKVKGTLLKAPGSSARFLMYRVELKVSKDIRKPFHCRPF